MRVLHVSTFKAGGAGSAARRLHECLVASGVDSALLTVDSPNAYLARKSTSICARIITRLKRILSSTDLTSNGKVKGNGELENEYEIFSSPYSDYDITQHPAYLDADIINLHWVASFIDIPSFFKKNKKPVVWTLHDMNPFQGGFHYQEDVVKNKHLIELENQYRLIKQKALSKTNLHVVALSKWIFQESINSAILGRFNHYLISNGLSNEKFKRYNQSFARDVFGLAHNQIIILFVCDFLNNKRKGFDLMQESIQKFASREDVLFCVVGRNKVSVNYSNLKYVDPVQDERLMGILYATANFVVIPSREDNLPNVMLEAMACGVPVITTPVGGMLDVVKSKFNGLFASDISSGALYEAILQALESEICFKKDDISDYIKYNYSSELQAEKYIELYNNILTS